MRQSSAGYQESFKKFYFLKIIILFIFIHLLIDDL